MYFSSNHVAVYKLLADFYDLFIELKGENSIHIVPHYITYPHPLYDESEILDENQKKELFKDCYGKGKYCVPHHGKTEGQLSDLEIIEENLTQKCIYYYAIEKKQYTIYYDYIKNIHSKCILEGKFNSECLKTVRDYYVPDQTIVNECIEKSFKYTGMLL